MTNDRRKSWYVVVRHHAKVPTTSYIEWQPNSGIKCIFHQLSWTSTYSTKYQNFVQKPICSTGNPPLTRFPLTRYPLMWFSKKQIFSFSQMSVWDFVFKVRSWHILGNCHLKSFFYNHWQLILTCLTSNTPLIQLWCARSKWNMDLKLVFLD